MPWKDVSLMSNRRRFVEAAQAQDKSMTDLCREFEISRKTGYKWLQRYEDEGEEGLQDRSKRPDQSPTRTDAAVEALVVNVRQEHPTWGGRKIRAFLVQQGRTTEQQTPAVSTITDILHRHQLIDPEQSHKHRAFQRFERSQPNELWQMDFKGHFPLTDQPHSRRCHPWGLLDDHSRFLLGLRACADETRVTVQAHLRSVFDVYGLPEAILMDNGSPWGTAQATTRNAPSDRSCGGQEAAKPRYTQLTVWLMCLGIRVIHGRPYHPQTQGKEERLHRTLQEELLQRTRAASLENWQRHFDAWRRMYNEERPHEALDMQVPASRYQPSARRLCEPLPPVVYPSSHEVRRVDSSGRVSFRNRAFRVSKAFRGQDVGLCATEVDGVWEVYFCDNRVGSIDLRH